MKKPSTPSAPPSQAPGRSPPASGWPHPQPGDVLSYAYLWAREAKSGQEEGLKDRPVAVVIASPTDCLVLVAPITHSAPADDQPAIELPRSVKRDLGLDAERSWIMLGEVNRFVWPGPDLRPLADGTPYHGALPDWLFLEMRDGIVAVASGGRLRMTRRSE